MTRRETLSRGGLLGAASFFVAASGATAAPRMGKPLVAYFSRGGNTRLAARQMRRDLNADLFEIVPATEYPEDYPTTVRQAEAETKRDFLPALCDVGPDVRGYDTILLGFPIWGMTAPPVIRSYLAAHDFAGRTLVPVITHGGYGVGQSLSVIAREAPKALLHEAFVMKAGQERESLEQVTKWLSKARLNNPSAG